MKKETGKHVPRSRKPKPTTQSEKASGSRSPRRTKGAKEHKLAEVTPITQNAKVDTTLPVGPVQDLTDTSSPVPASAQVRGHGATALFGLTPLASAFRYIEPTWRNYISYVDMEARAGNVDAQYFIRIWQS